MAPSVPDLVLGDPVLLVALAIAVRVVVAWQRSLTYPEYRLAHLAKCRLFQLLDPLATRYGRPLVRTKNYAPQDREFVEHIHENPRTVAQTITPPFSAHLLATAKRRTHPERGYQWAHSQWRATHDDGTQTEVYLFPDAGGTDVYAHVEDRVEDPEGHLRDGQEPGDYHSAFEWAYHGGERS